MTVKLTKSEIAQICSTIKDEQISQVTDYVMFLGHAHSGHSLIGALLDAHQDIAISNEINIPKLVLDHNLSKAEILKLTLFFSNIEKRWEGQINTGYKYKVRGGFQGETIKPLILGDKKGGGSTRIIRKHEAVFEKIYQAFDNKLKIIHVIRNPMDNIAAFAHYWGEELGMAQVDRYYENMETVLKLKSKYPKIFHTINHSAFIKNPRLQLIRLFDFLGVSPEKQFLDSCTELVKPVENKRSEQLNWPIMLEEIIKNKNIQFNLTDY